MSDERTVEHWADDYRRRREKYVTFTDRLAELLRVLLPEAGVDVHQLRGAARLHEDRAHRRDVRRSTQ